MSERKTGGVKSVRLFIPFVFRCSVWILLRNFAEIFYEVTI